MSDPTPGREEREIILNALGFWQDECNRLEEDNYNLREYIKRLEAELDYIEDRLDKAGISV